MRIVIIRIWIMITVIQLTTSLPVTNLVNDQDTNAVKSNYENSNKISSRNSGPDSDPSWDYDSNQDYDDNSSDKTDSRRNDNDGCEKKSRSKISRNACSSCSSCNEKTMNNSLTKGSPRDKATQIATKAAQDAKAANDAQLSAAKEAARHVKAELAEKALQAAKAAEAALAGKQQVMEQLEHETSAAEAVIKDEEISQRTSQANYEATQQAAHCSDQQFKALSAVFDNSKENLENLERVRNGAEQELAQKKQLLDAAKLRMAMLHKQIKDAQDDLDKTKCAAYKAACAAVESQQKASRS